MLVFPVVEATPLFPFSFALLLVFRCHATSFFPTLLPPLRSADPGGTGLALAEEELAGIAGELATGKNREVGIQRRSPGQSTEEQSELEPFNGSESTM